MSELFDFEQLDVWKKAVEFADKVISLADELDSSRKHYRLIEQIEAAASSIALNIAEGKGRFSKKEYVMFLYYARGSIYEVVTMLTIFFNRGWIDRENYTELKEDAIVLSKMLNGLIRAIKSRY